MATDVTPKPYVSNPYWLNGSGGWGIQRPYIPDQSYFQGGGPPLGSGGTPAPPNGPYDWGGHDTVMVPPISGTGTAVSGGGSGSGAQVVTTTAPVPVTQTPATTSGFDLSSIPTWAWLGVAAVAALYFMGGRGRGR